MHGEHGAAEQSPTGRRTVPRNRLRISLVATAIAALSLTACTSDPAPVGTPPDGNPVTSTSAAATPEPTRPVEEATPESAIQFTRYFWDLYNYAYQTYDTAPLKAISDPGCKFCASTVTNVGKIHDNGSMAQGFTIEIIEMTSPPVKITTGTLVVAVVKQAPGQIRTGSDTTSSDPGWKKLRTSFSLKWDGTSWFVEAMDADLRTGVR